MSFLDVLPKGIKDQKALINKLQWELRDMYHSCDCEHCDFNGLSDDYTEDDVEAKELEIAEAKADLKRYERYAELNKVALV